MLKIAITGNIASGKSAFESFLKTRGFKVIDTDKLAHNLLKIDAVKAEFRQTFPDRDIFEGSEISRPKLGKIVFGDDSLMKKLEGILHPKVMQEVTQIFAKYEKAGEKAAFASVPQLFEAGLEKAFDKVILVYTNDDIRLARLMKRKGCTKEEAELRMSKQMSQDKKSSQADFVVYNNKDLACLEQETDRIINLLI